MRRYLVRNLVGATLLIFWAFPSPARAENPPSGNQNNVKPVPAPYNPIGKGYSYNRDGSPYNPIGRGYTAPVTPRPNTDTRTTPKTNSGDSPRRTTYPYPGAYPYPYPYPYPYYPYYPGPVVVPAETLYGPQAVKRFMGVDQSPGDKTSSRSDTGASATPRPAPIIAPRDADPPKKVEPAVVAKRYIETGNSYFGKHKYFEAQDRYKKAAEAAPDLPEPQYRQAFAAIAAGRYDLAVTAFKQGIQLDPNWLKTNLVVTSLYKDDEDTKRAHLDAVAAMAEQSPQNGDLMFLLGAFLYADGKTDRAKSFFQAASELSPDAAHLKPFLENAKPGAEAP